MAEVETLTITLPLEVVIGVKAAVDDGEYDSASDVVREAIFDWKMKRLQREQQHAALKVDIEKGLTDLAAGRVKNFNRNRIVERGRALSVVRLPSA